MRLVIIVDVNEDEIDVRKEPEGDSLRAFRWSLQDAFDCYWSLARMGSVRLLDVREQREPTETELIGPLG